MRDGEAQGARAVNVDGLTTGDDDILKQRLVNGSMYIYRRYKAYQGVLAVDNGVVGAAGAAGDNLARAVGGALAAEEEVGAGGSQREEVDGGARASSNDAESTGVILSFGADTRARKGSHERNERQKSRNLHCERVLRGSECNWLL